MPCGPAGRAVAGTASGDLQAAGRKPGQAVEPIVVGGIPCAPAAFVARQPGTQLAGATGSGQVAVLCAVAGVHGVGTTQVAAAYARDRVAEGWGLVAWINAQTWDALLAGLARTADALGVGDPGGDSRESARRLRDHLQARTGESLLVFDDATSPWNLRLFLPAAGHAHVVITTTYTEWTGTDLAFSDLGVTVDVPAFNRQESLAYLRERTGLTDQDAADAVARELGDLPLGLAQAAAVIAQRHLTCRAYLDKLRRVPVDRLLRRPPGQDYPRPVTAALLLSVQAAEDADPSGLTSRVLRVLAALSPEGVRRGLLGGLQTGAAKEQVQDALNRCAAGSLLTWSITGDAVIMHRQLGRVLRERDRAAGQWPGTVSAAADLLEPRLFPEDQAGDRQAERAELAAHVEALWHADSEAGTAHPDQAARLLQARSWAVRQLVAAADLDHAIDVAHQILADSRRVLGPDHPQSLTSQHNLAYACESAGRLGEAIPLYEQNLASSERVLGPDHPQTLTTRNNLAYAYTSAGRLGGAIALFEPNLAGRERVLGPDHPDTIGSRINLAYAYASSGRLGEAIPLYQRGLADSERVLGPDDRRTLTSRRLLAHACVSSGRLGEAITLYEQALGDSERVFGPDDPQTLTSRDHLAHACESAGRLGEAIPLYEQNLGDCERVLGPDDPQTLGSRDNLAAAYASAERLGEAIRLYEQALADRERVLGPDHPDSVSGRDNLATCYESAGRLGEAIPLYEQNLDDCERVLGPDDPQTLGSRDSLAAAYTTAGRPGEAIRLYEQNLAGCERVLGPDHPQTLTTRSNLEKLGITTTQQ